MNKCFSLALLVGFAGIAVAQSFHFKRIDSGFVSLVGVYHPQRLNLTSTKPAGLKKAPAGLSAPMYGEIKLGPADSQSSYVVIVDEPAGKPAQVFIDSNGDGDLTNDATIIWKPFPYKDQAGKDLTRNAGSAVLVQKFGSETTKPAIQMYKFDKNDTARAALKDVLLYYSDWGTQGEVQIGGKTYKAMLNDTMATGDFRGAVPTDKQGSGVEFLIDVNRNGKFDRRGEQYDVRKPFNIGGTTYEISKVSPSGTSFMIAKSSQTVAEVLPPPDLGSGKKIEGFAAKDMDGNAISFPNTYKGKLVMLDFWATWCGPCRGEIPGLVKAYEKYHPKGFEICGVTLDQENMADKVKEFTKGAGMTWQQIYDGKFWNAEIAQKYVIQAIPAAFLVDGDTGEIVASGDQLRGESLVPTLEKALAKKFGNK